ncbi:hypothetical protein BCR24_12230 [Enterococcus ureilyticus]|uniref:Uncharacterized protein n=1 Tax=Enterococcus ureilyticus TaxID=1131292 RepID=A0A1E5HEB9_9ENTE|nr:hypothetical protein [Enterococcus ureilyticus]MBM7689529.1 hypothetical protein [Enterococcus ureilyticus]MBO0446259.1 hypothetical protein [Enterococcus ureilyticus]OEG23284.1 hypothetical protein BCR24_12230 [Enterococcus ureilyticus]
MKIFYASLFAAAILFLLGMSIDSHLNSNNVELIFFDDNLLTEGYGNNIGVLFAGSIIVFFGLVHGSLTKRKTLTKKSKLVAVVIIFISLIVFVISALNLSNYYFS